jgi:hypothetical protein
MITPHPNEAMSDGSYRSGLSQSVVGEIVRERAEAVAEVARLRTEVSDLRLWIDSVGRTCPSNATIDAFLLGDDDA